ncbi:MAG: HYR domain-containing protein, partial [Bacteroidota bacterium]
MEKINFTLQKLKLVLFVLLVTVFGQQYAIGQTCTAPNQCTPTPGFPDAPASLDCGTGFSATAIFTEDFDNGFGVFTEDAVINGTGANDLTVSTAGDTPSFGTGPETTAGCNGNANDGEFIFLEGSFTLVNEIHCMTANIPIPATSATVNTPYILSFWYHMFGDNIGTLEILVNGASEFSVSGQQQTANCAPWLQGTVDVTALAGTTAAVQICMSEGDGSVSTFESDISIDQIQIFACAQVCELTCPADIVVDNDPGLCGATVDPSPTASAACGNPIINDFNGTENAMDFYPVGTTTVTFSTTDEFGNPVSCSVDVTVNDVEPVEIVGCDPIEVDLRPTECCANVNFNVQAVDNCAANANEEGTISTIFTDGNGASGNMFDVENVSSMPVTLTGMFEGNVEPFGGPPDISVYYTTTATTHVGNENDPTAWTLIGTANDVISVGQNMPTPYDVGGTLTLMPGQSVGLFVSDNTSSIDYSNGTDTYNDGVLEIRSGNGRGLNAANPFAGGTFAGRIWNGSIVYEISQQIEVVQTDMTGLSSGDCFPIGETVLTFLVTDPAGSTATCEKVITVNEFIPSSITMACNDMIFLSLDTLCEATVSPDMVLEGDNYGCLDNYTVELFYDEAKTQPVPTSPMLTSADLGRTIIAQVIDPNIGLTCWGRVVVEDKIAPRLECPCAEGGSPVTEVSGDIQPDDPTWNRTNNFGNNPGTCAGTAGGVESYETFTFSISAPDVYTFDMPSIIGPDFFFVLYDGPFDPANPCANAIAANDDTNGSEPSITINLTAVPGTYTLVTTTFGTDNDAGAYTYNITSANGGQVLAADPACTVFCFEAQSFPTPTATDACGIASLTSEDEVIDGGACGTSTIRRTWTATDIAGNTTSCVQVLNTIPGTADDIVAPPNYDGVDQPALNCENRCGGAAELADNRFCGPSDLYWNVIPDGQPYAGNPSPDDGKVWGCGAVKCFGTGNPGGSATCGNFNSTFEDTRINICTSGSSDGCYKILRKWSVLDWCESTVTFVNQVIKVEDNEGPVIADIVDATVSTDVWRCEADYILPEPWLMDNCNSAPLDFTVTATGGTIGTKSGRRALKGLAPGVYQVTYTATDCCGNESSVTIDLTVVDDVPPVAVCDRNTVVNLTTTTDETDDNLGITKIFASSFDDGSFDSCSPEIWFKAIRMDEFDSNGNGKPGEAVGPAGDWEAIDCDGANGDDDIRVFPPPIVVGVDGCSTPVGLISNTSYRQSQAYFDDFVKFCCADIEDGPIMVVFRVFDVDPTCYEFRNVFPAGNPQFDAWYASNPHKDPSEYTGVIAEAMSASNWPVPGAGPGPLYGRFSDCMVEVEVQDKLPPFVVAPPNVVVTCDFWFEFDPDNPNDYTESLDAVFGKVVEGSADLADRDSIFVLDRVCPIHPRFSEFAPASPFDDPCYDDQYDIFWGIDGYVLDNCDIDLEQTIIPNLTCGQGTITRRWQAADAQGNWSNIATQTITIINCREFYVPTVCWRRTSKDVGDCDLVGGQFLEKLIEWPCDIELNRCQGPIDEVFLPDNLDILLDQDRRPRFADDNCSLIATSFEDRVFTFVDSSCLKIFREWEVIDWCRFDAGLTPFLWEWTQVIKLQNTNGPVIEDCGQTVCGYGNPNNPNAPQCVGEVVVEPSITDDCTPLDELRIDYKFDYFNDGIYDELGFSSTYGQIYPFPNPNGLPVRRFEPADYAIRGFYPVGTHRILWAAEDGCGNANLCEYILTIEDCKPPTAYCLPGVSTIPMPDVAGGFVDIWASDFDLGSIDNCTAQEDLVFSFSDDINDRSLRRFCTDVTGLPEELTIYVWDEAGNFATCLVGLLLNDCGGNSTATISGDIQNEEGEDVEGVMVYVENTSMNDQEETGIDGFFSFILGTDQNYVVRPEKDVRPLNGVSTYDLVVMSKHILGIDRLTSPYKLIAADVNNSGEITAFDMVDLRKLILFIDTEFQNNTSWRFVPKDYRFLNNDPFAQSFPEVYDINDLTDDMKADFVAIKVGDLNESARPNLAIGSQTRSAVGDLNFQAD